MSNSTIPLAVPDDLYAEVKSTATDTHLSMADVMRQSMKLGLPRLRKQFQVKGRVTNVDPLSEKALARIYARPERDEAGLKRLMTEQAAGGRD